MQKKTCVEFGWTEETTRRAICIPDGRYDTVLTISIPRSVIFVSKWAMYVILHSVPPRISVVYLSFLSLLCRLTFYHFSPPLHFISRFLFVLWLLISPFALCTTLRIFLPFFFLLVVFAFLDTLFISVYSFSLSLLCFFCPLSYWSKSRFASFPSGYRNILSTLSLKITDWCQNSE